MLWFVVIRNRRQQCCWCYITEHWPYKCSNRGGEKDKVESVLERREVQNSSPEKLCERALRRREYRRRQGITEKLTTQRRHEKLTKES